MKNWFLLAALVATSWFRKKPSMVDAFPDGAGGCMGGMAAVEGLHLDTSNGRPVVGGTLADGAIRVTVGEMLLDVNTVNELPVGQDLLVGVEADDIMFLGVLVRLQAPDGIDTTGALIPGANVGPASACQAPVVGITHMNNDPKTMATGTLRFDEEIQGITLDVTIVFLNAPEGSAYVYSGFDIQTRALGSESPAGNVSPTLAPSPSSEGPLSGAPSSEGSSAQSVGPSSSNNSAQPISFTQSPVSSATSAPNTVPSPPAAVPAPAPATPPTQSSTPAAPTSETNFPTPLESTAYPTFYGYKKTKKPHYPYYPNYGKGKKSKGGKGKGHGSYYGKGKGKSSKSKKSKSKSSSSYKNGGSGGKGKGVNGGQLFRHKIPADGHYYFGPHPGKGRAQELHVTRTGGGHKRDPVKSVFN